MKKVAMIGIGKLGQDCAEVMAYHYDVIGYDVKHRNPSFPMANSIEEAVNDRDLIFIAAPTPHDPKYEGELPTSHLENKNFDYTIVEEILREVNNYVNQTQLIVLISTVLPGTVREKLRPCITNARFIYNPYLIAMGTIKHDMVNPEMVIIGTEDGSTTGDAQELIDFYKVFMENDPRYVVGTWDEAESIKIFYNTFISTKLALVNMIQDVAETSININVDVVTKALAESTYRIMGPAYMTAGLGDAGACHPRDNIALRWLAEKLELGYDLFDSIMKAREVQAERMALRCLKNGKNITIVGKAYKPKVPYTNGSVSLLTGHYIEKHGGNVRYFDPHTGDNNLYENWTDVYLIGYWDEYTHRLNFPQWTTVIDPWRKLTPKNHTGEIIHYGNTRPKNRYNVTPADLQNHIDQIFEIYPDLLEIENEIHIIYAGVRQETTFRLRPFEDLVKEIQDAHDKGKTKFLFDNQAEDFFHDIVKKIHRISKMFEGIIPSHCFVYLCGANNIEECYKKIVNDHEIENEISLLSCNYFQYTSQKKSKMFEFSGEYQTNTKEKKFLCFNKEPRKHRIELLDKMLYHNMLDTSYYSFEGNENWLEIVKNEQKYDNIIKNIDIFPLRLNITESRKNPVDITVEDMTYFTKSLFSVVTETVFYGTTENSSSVFFSEKIYKPIILGHPFIIVGRPFSLKTLKDMGYKTFSPFIDERYDSIQDDDERLKFVIDEISRLCNMDLITVQAWQKNIKPIVDHNKTHFFDVTDHSITESPLEIITKESSIIPKIKKRLPTKQITVEKIVELSDEEIQWEKLMKNPPIANEFGIFTIPSNQELDERIFSSKITKKLSSGLEIDFSILLDGGGIQVVQDLISAVKKINPEKIYKNTLEWCAGMGAIGFDFLGHNITERLVFQDYIEYAQIDILNNATKLNLVERVKYINSSTVSSLPDTEKFDLVIANPPHVSDFFEFAKNSKNQGGRPEPFLQSARMVVDHKYSAHKDFFQNIRKYITADADILLVENSDNSTFKQWAFLNGLMHIESYKMPVYEEILKGNMTRARIMHFRPKNL